MLMTDSKYYNCGYCDFPSKKSDQPEDKFKLDNPLKNIMSIGDSYNGTRNKLA